MNYIPILKYKDRIDMSAYTTLNLNQKDITPLVELFQSEKIEMQKIDKEKEFFLSMLVDKNMKFKHAVDYFEEAKLYHPNLIPVINSDYNFEPKKDSFKAAKKFFHENKKIGIKINGIDNLFMRDTFENILMLMVDDYSELHVFLDIDFAYKYNQSDLVEHFSNAIDYFTHEIDNSIINFSLAGSVVRVSSIGLETFDGDKTEYNKKTNNLLRTYYELIEKYQHLNISYSDYTIDEKYMFTDDSGGGSFYPSAKFTNKEGDFCIYKSDSLSEFSKYKDIASIIKKNPDYTIEHCDGCKYIDDIDMGRKDGKGTGNPSTWKINMMIHHIYTMIKILS